MTLYIFLGIKKTASYLLALATDFEAATNRDDVEYGANISVYGDIAQLKGNFVLLYRVIFAGASKWAACPWQAVKSLGNQLYKAF